MELMELIDVLKIYLLALGVYYVVLLLVWSRRLGAGKSLVTQKVIEFADQGTDDTNSVEEVVYENEETHDTPEAQDITNDLAFDEDDVERDEESISVDGISVNIPNLPAKAYSHFDQEGQKDENEEFNDPLDDSEIVV